MIPTTIIIIFLATMFLAIDPYVYYGTHKIMVKSHTREYGKGNFEQFLEQFNKINWQRDEAHPYSFFGKDIDANKIHASIICFNGKGMILTYWGFIRFRIWLHKNKYQFSRNTVKW